MKLLKFYCVLFCILSGALQTLAQECKGMTWTVREQKGKYVRVGKSSTTNPYRGDTPCDMKLPILAIKVIGGKRPIIKGVTYDYYQGWCRGFLKLTPPVLGSKLTSLEEANRIIQVTLGNGWRMAEHHDGGGGWSYWGYGRLPKDVNFWVYINDQRANPWNSVFSAPTNNNPKSSSDTNLPINVARLVSTNVSASSVNGNKSLTDSYYGVLNLFDEGIHVIDGINYTTWMTDNSSRHWVNITFASPIVLNKIMIECVYSRAPQGNLTTGKKKVPAVYAPPAQMPREFAVDIVLDKKGVRSIEKLPSVNISGFRTFYPLNSWYHNVLAVTLIFPGPSQIELSEIEIIGIPRILRGDIAPEKGVPTIAREQ